MSDNWLRYVPADPWFRPESTAAEKSRVLLSSFLPEAEEVTAEFFPIVQFVDPGGNWSGVCCPLCGADAEPWWFDAVSAAADAAFVSLDAHAPCCGAKTSLNDMNFVWPAAFGSFVLDAMNPNAEALSSDQLRQLEHELGSAVREIARHL